MSRGEHVHSFYRGDSNIDKYVEARVGLGGSSLVEQLKSMLEPGSSVLELGMGPGNDLLLLSDSFEVVGSDYSGWFLDRFRKEHPEIEVSELDAVSIATSREFDCVFSNKVLHHLSPSDLTASLLRQAVIVRKGGIIFHSFWNGDEETIADGLRFKKYMPETMAGIFSGFGDVIITESYAELAASDSFFIAARI